MNAFCLIPAFDAEQTIGDVVLRARAVVERVVVVDDGSNDLTAAAARARGAAVIRLPQNQGKGAALRAGFAHALNSGAQMVCTIDADGENAPEDLPRLAGALQSGQFEAALGARTQTHSSLLTGFKTTKLLLREWLSVEFDDAMSGVRAYRASALERIAPRLRANGFGIDLEIALRLTQLKIPFVEIPISGELVQARSGFRPSHIEAFLENVQWFAEWRGAPDAVPAGGVMEAVRRREPFELKVGRRAKHFRYNSVLGLYE